MTLAYIFSKNYLFDMTPPSYSRLTIYLLALFAIMILLVVYVKLMPRNLSKIYGKLNPPLLTVGFVGLIYIFARYESLPYFSSRAFLILLALIFLVWGGIVALGISRFMKDYSQKTEIETRYNKYLPKSKTKAKN